MTETQPIDKIKAHELLQQGTRIPLFDIDWTLLEGGNKVHNSAFDYALHTVYNLRDASMDEIVPHGMIDTQILMEVLKLHGVSEQDAKTKIPQAIDAMKEYFMQHQDDGRCIALPGVKQLLEEL